MIPGIHLTIILDIILIVIGIPIDIIAGIILIMAGIVPIIMIIITTIILIMIKNMQNVEGALREHRQVHMFQVVLMWVILRQ